PLSGKQERIIKWYPAEARGLKPAAHRNAIGKLRLDAELIEHPVCIIVPLLLLDLLLPPDQDLDVIGIEVVIGICPQRLPRFENLWILRTGLKWWIHLTNGITRQR